jgi:hypothetical protein
MLRLVQGCPTPIGWVDLFRSTTTGGHAPSVLVRDTVSQPREITTPARSVLALRCTARGHALRVRRGPPRLLHVRAPPTRENDALRGRARQPRSGGRRSDPDRVARFRAQGAPTSSSIPISMCYSSTARRWRTSPRSPSPRSRAFRAAKWARFSSKRWPASSSTYDVEGFSRRRTGPTRATPTARARSTGSPCWPSRRPRVARRRPVRSGDERARRSARASTAFPARRHPRRRPEYAPLRREAFVVRSFVSARARARSRSSAIRRPRRGSC